MAEYWQVEFREMPSFGEGFVVRLSALPREDHCRYEVKRGSRWELELEHDRPLTASGTMPRAAADAVYAALARAAVVAVPLEGVGILDATSYSFSINAGASGAIYSWKCDLPDAWRLLQPAIDLLTQLAQKHV